MSTAQPPLPDPAARPPADQLARAQAANRAAWRAVGFTALAFLIVGFVPVLGWAVAAVGLLVVPVFAVAVVIGNARRERAALAGRYDEAVAGAGVDAGTLQTRTWASVLVAAGIVVPIVAGAHALVFTALCLVAAAALRPWRKAIRSSPN